MSTYTLFGGPADGTPVDVQPHVQIIEWPLPWATPASIGDYVQPCEYRYNAQTDRFEYCDASRK